MNNRLRVLLFLLLATSSLLCGCTSGPQPNVYNPAVSTAARLLTAKVTNFKGTGMVLSYQSSYESGWVTLLQFANDQKVLDGSKVIAKSQEAGWIMTERKMGWIEAAHDVHFLERLNDRQVRIEVVSREAARANPERAAALHEKLAGVFNRVE